MGNAKGDDMPPAATREPRAEPGAHRDGLLAFFLKPLRYLVLRIQDLPRSAGLGHVRRPSQLNAFRNAMKTGTVSERGRPPERPERVSKRDENGAEFVAAHPPRP